MIKFTHSARGSLYAALSGFLYGFIGYFGVSTLKKDMSLMTMLMWRFIITALVILVFILFKRIGFKKIPKTEVLKSLIYGIIFYGGSSITYFMASNYIGTGLAMVIVFTYPILVLLSNIVFYGERIKRIYLTSIAIIMIGMIFLVSDKSMTFDFYGAFLALLCAITYAAYIVFSKKQMSSLDPIVSSLMIAIANIGVFFTAALLDNTLSIPHNFETWINITGVGLVCTALPIILLLEAMKYISSEKASLLSVLEPVCVVVIGVYALDEQLSIFQTLGITLILGAAILVQFDKAEGSKRKL